MKIEKIMQEQGLKYYSALNPIQKDNIFKDALSMKEGLMELPKGLRNQILKQIDLNKILEFRNHFDKLIKGQKCFKYKGNYYPLNIKEIIN